MLKKPFFSTSKALLLPGAPGKGYNTVTQQQQSAAQHILWAAHRKFKEHSRDTPVIQNPKWSYSQTATGTASPIPPLSSQSDWNPGKSVTPIEQYTL